VNPARHRRLVALLLVLATLVTPLAISAFWLRNEVLDTQRYVQTVTPLSSNRAIDAAVATEITNALFAHVNVTAEAQKVLPKKAQFLTLPLATGLRAYTQDGVVKFLQTPQFRLIWQTANRQAHEALVAALEGKTSAFIEPDGTVDIKLANAAVAARAALAEAGLHVFDQVKPQLLQKRLVIAKPHSLKEIRRGVSMLRALAIVLPLLAVALVGFALLLSGDRRRTLVRTGISLIVAGVLGILLIVVLRSYYLDQVVGPGVPRAAATAFYDTLLASLRFDMKLACLAGLAVTGGAWVAGPSPRAVWLRTTVLRAAGRLADEAVGEAVTLNWAGRNKSALRTATVLLGLLLLLSASGPTLHSLLRIALGVGIVLLLIEVLARPTGGGARGSGSGGTVEP
jgi:hypothetical protein